MSHIIFKKVIIDAFLSFDHAELDLETNGITYIKGNNNSDSKSNSNGSGKSALVSESILWCLTGNTSRSTKIVSNLYLDRGASVTVLLEKDGHHYEVTRGTHKSLVGNGLFIVKDGVSVTKPRIADTEAYLETELPELDWQVMTSILVLSQGLINGFSTLTNRDRKERLEKLANMESVFSGVKSLADNVYDRLLLKYNAENAKLLGFNSKVTANTTLINSLNATIASIEEKNKLVVSDDVKQIKVAQLNDLIKAESLREAEVNKTLTDLNLKSKDLTFKSDQASAEYNKIANSINNNKTQLNQLTLTIKRNTDELTKVSIELNTATDNAICPTCLQVIADDAAKHVHVTYEERKAKLTEELYKDSQKISALEESIKNDTVIANEAAAVLTGIRNELNAISADISTNISLSRSIANNIAMYNNQIKSMDVKADSIDVYKTQISSLVVENDNLSVSIAGCIRELAELEKQVSIAKWLVAQTTRSIRSYMLEGVINYINMKCKEYSEYLFDDAVVRLEADGSSLDIYLGDKLVENISGGEHRRLDIILQLAVRDLVMMQVGFTSNILVIDEVFDNLDNLGMSTVLDLVMSQKDVINSIFLITHKNDADLDYDKLLTVEKGSDNISRIA